MRVPQISNSFHNLFLLLLLTLNLVSLQLSGQSFVNRLILSKKNTKGFVLFSPETHKSVFLIDKSGYVINEWKTDYYPGLAVRFLEDGSILRASRIENKEFEEGGRVGGLLQKISWDGTILWEYKISDSSKVQHHDIEVTPEGNVILLIWKKLSYEQSLKTGRLAELIPEKGLWTEQIMMLKPKGKNDAEIVWILDLLNFSKADSNQKVNNTRNQELRYNSLDINFNSKNNSSNIIHLNSIDYNPNTKQIMICSKLYSEIFIIDEPNEKNSFQLKYRMGNPNFYSITNSNEKRYNVIHDAQWTNNNKHYPNSIILFHNNVDPDAEINFSKIEIRKPNLVNETDSKIPNYSTAEYPKLIWSYNIDNSDSTFFSKNTSGVQLLENGNIFVCEGDNGKFFEVNKKHNKVWEYVSPAGNDQIYPENLDLTDNTNSIFKVIFISPKHMGLKGKNLSPKRKL